MKLKDIDYTLGRIENLCIAFKQSMSMDHLPYPTLQMFQRYFDIVIDDYESSHDSGSLLYCLDLLGELYTLNNPNLLFDSKQADIFSVEKLDDYKDLEHPVYVQTIAFHKLHMRSERHRVYSDYLENLRISISQRLNTFGIFLKEDFTAEVKIRAKVTIEQLRKVVILLQELGYIDNDKDTANAFLSLFTGSALAQQRMRVCWKCLSKTSGNKNESMQNIAALYLLFDTLGVDLKNPSNRMIIEKVFLNGGTMKPRNMSDFLRGFKAQIEKSLK
jgi:hypothetical protein